MEGFFLYSYNYNYKCNFDEHSLFKDLDGLIVTVYCSTLIVPYTEMLLYRRLICFIIFNTITACSVVTPVIMI